MTMEIRGTRRTLLKAAMAGAAVLSAPSIIRAQSRKLVYATWGGSWETALRKAWFDPFTKATGIEVVTATGNTYGKLRAMVEAGSVEWDVVEVDPDLQYMDRELNVLEKLDFGKIDTANVMEGKGIFTDVAVPQVLWSVVNFYNTKTFGDAGPANWKDLWDLQKFPGKRLACGWSANFGTLEVALLSDGVAPKDLYPIDVDRALKRLTEIRDELVWFNTNSEIEQLTLGERAVLGIASDGRLISAIDQGAPLAIHYDDSLMFWSQMVVPKGAPNKAEAMEFLNFTLTPEAQAAIAREYSYGPVVAKAFDLLDPKRAAILSGGPQQQGKFHWIDFEWWAANREKVQEQFNLWKLG